MTDQIYNFGRRPNKPRPEIIPEDPTWLKRWRRLRDAWVWLRRAVGWEWPDGFEGLTPDERARFLRSLADPDFAGPVNDALEQDRKERDSKS